MASSSVGPVDLTVEPDLQPLYPTPSQIAHLLSPYVGLSPQQKAELVSHCLLRACQFGDMLLLSHLLTDPNAHPYVDLAKQDEDGLGLISLTILGFGSESERDIEREECVRLLISEGCDVNVADKGPSVAGSHSQQPQILTLSTSWLDSAPLCFSAVTSNADITPADPRSFALCSDSAQANGT